MNGSTNLLSINTSILASYLNKGYQFNNTAKKLIYMRAFSLKKSHKIKKKFYQYKQITKC